MAFVLSFYVMCVRYKEQMPFFKAQVDDQIRLELTSSHSSDQLFNWANNNYQHVKWSLMRILENKDNMTRKRRLFVNVMTYQSLPPSFAASLPSFSLEIYLP